MPIKHIAQSTLPTRFGQFDLHIFRNGANIDLMVLACGQPKDGCLVRIHSECATGDILGSLRCDCRDQLEASLKIIGQEGCGLFIYVRGHEGRGIGLANKIKAYALQDKGMDTVEANLHLGFPADAREYGAVTKIIKHFGLKKVRLLTNNRKKMEALENAGIHIEERVPLWTASNPFNEGYIHTKQDIMGHLPGCQDKE